MARPFELADLSPKFREQALSQLAPQPVGIPQAIKRRKTPEADLQNEIVAYLQDRGYKVAFFRPARVVRNGVETYETPVGGDGAGFPDVIAAGHKRLIVIENKSETGTVKPEQLEWLREFMGIPGATVMVVRPSSWPDLRSLL